MGCIRPHAKPQAASGHEVQVRGLARDENGLALRQDQNPGDELDSLRQPGEIGERHQRIVERVMLGVGPPERRITVLA